MVGIGHELRGDDAVGVLIARQLQEQLEQRNNLLILDAGVAPENVTGQLRRFAPASVILIDAVDMNAEAGTISMIDLTNPFVERVSSTHTISLHLFADYLQTQLHCEIHLLGIQALDSSLDRSLSSAVSASLRRIVACF